MENKNLAKFMDAAEYTQIQIAIEYRLYALTKLYEKAMELNMMDNVKLWEGNKKTLEKAKHALESAWFVEFNND